MKERGIPIQEPVTAEKEFEWEEHPIQTLLEAVKLKVAPKTGVVWWETPPSLELDVVALELLQEWVVEAAWREVGPMWGLEFVWRLWRIRPSYLIGLAGLLEEEGPSLTFEVVPAVVHSIQWFV